MIARTPTPPYYAVLFTSLRTSGDPESYEEVAQCIAELAAQQPGFLGVESARGEGAMLAQQLGRSRWYEAFSLRICRVETERLFEREGARLHAEPRGGGEEHG